MSEPITAERFEEFVDLFTEKHVEIMTTLTAHTDRLDRIERILWQGERLAELEKRIRTLAGRTGYPDLATPLEPPLGHPANV